MSLGIWDAALAEGANLDVIKELRGMAGTEDLAESLVELHMMEPGATVFNLSCDLPKWTRGGSESYILPFTLQTKNPGGDVNAAKYILKACISMATADNPEAPSMRLLGKRQQLSENGIPAPVLHGYKNGVFLEEFISDDIRAAFTKNSTGVLEQAATYYGTLARLGYQPVDAGLLRDFRFAQGELKCIDFGSDLGAPSQEPTNLWEVFKKEAQAELGVSAEQVETFKPHYEEARLNPVKLKREGMHYGV